jgi:hypothetical protein
MDRLLTVTVPATAVALTTAASVMAEVGAVSADQGVVSSLIAQASAAIVAHLGRTLARETVREAFRLIEPEPHLLLERAPVVSIASVVVDDLALTTDEWEADFDAGLLYRIEDDCRFLWRARRVVVTYTGGYLLPGVAGRTLPPDIERACQIAAAESYQARGRDPRLRSESADGIGSQSWIDPKAGHGALPWQAAELLAPHRRPA